MTEPIGIFIFFFAVIDPIGSVPVFMLVASWIHRVIGDKGASVVSAESWV